MSPLRWPTAFIARPICNRGRINGEKKLGSILKLPPMPRAPIETRTITYDELIAMQPREDDDEPPRI